MSRVEDNWKLCLQAVASAKQDAPRSANQHYFYSKSPFADKIRHRFLLDCTRGSNYRKRGKAYEKDPQLASRRKMVEELMAGPQTLDNKKRQIDAWIAAWGADYFERAADLEDVWHAGGKDFQWKKMAKHTGISKKQAKAMTKEEWIDFVEMFKVKMKNAETRKFAVGNCHEKATLAAEYLADWSFAGRKLAICCLEEEHLGITGGIVRLFDKDEDAGKGDHVFCIYDFDEISNRLWEFGPNAIIVDGWMNDAYPAREYLTWKYGYNYKGHRINLKQFNCRNMICVSYRNHIETMHSWELPEGPERQSQGAKRHALPY
jgi:hypothetical protein